ncbi:E3 ubiquitin-protein ligase dtx3l [Mactra antiquata]
MTSSTVPQKIVSGLKKETGGLKKVAEELQSKYGLKVIHDKGLLQITAEENDILELAIEMLDRRVGKDKSEVEKELGEKSTVKWTFRGSKATHASYLFKEEVRSLEDNYKITVKETIEKNKVKSVIITCSYETYPTFIVKFEQLDKMIVDCVKEELHLSGPKEAQMAKKFATQRNDKYYCEFRNDKLIVWGKDKENCNVGKEAWQKELSKSKPEEKKKDKTEENDKEKDPQPAPNKDEQSNKPDTNNHNGASIDPQKDNTDKNPDIDNDNGNDTPNMDNQIKREPGEMNKVGNIDRYSFGINGMAVHLYKHSIIDLKDMDAITNAANERLAHGGGVAYFISKAAGKSMDDECRRYIEQNNAIPVSQCYVSKPGYIKCKGIIHAVGPSWSDYKNKIECAKALYDTIWNVLAETRKRSWKKVALPAISSAIFGVPKQLCAEMYIKAFVDFGNKYGGVVEVHFVDVNQEMVDLVREAHCYWVGDPLLLDIKNALSYVGAAGQSSQRKKMVPTSTLKFTGEKMTSYGEKMYTFKVCDRLSLKVYMGDLTKVKSVDIVAVPWYKPEGLLMKAFKEMLGKNYHKFLDERSRSPDCSVLIYRTANYSPDVATIVIRPTSGEPNITNVVRRLLKFSYDRHRSIALPFMCQVGQNPSRVCELMVDGIKEVASQKISIEEVHFVNFDPKNMTSIQKVFKDKALPTTGNYGLPFPGSQKGAPYPSAPPEPEWIKHEPIEVNQPQDVMLTSKSITSKSGTMKAASSGTKCLYHNNKDAAIMLDCSKHGLCKTCQAGKPDSKCPQCKPIANSNSATKMQQCPICMDDVSKPKVLKCQHILCDACYAKVMKSTPKCPQCGLVLGIIIGDQPPGRMLYRTHKSIYLPGFEEEQCGTIEIWYEFPSGKQQENHPNPGKGYKGTQRRAFLPDNAEGREILHLLRKAFDRKLIFTIGHSTSTGEEDVITWNDIHHKTQIDGNTHGYGYPDPTYLKRVREELDAKGVTGNKGVAKLYPDLSGLK